MMSVYLHVEVSLLTTTAQTNTLITFEHPLNEQVRLYLRLEYLFNEFKKNLMSEDPSANKQALSALLKIINVVDRPDLKTKLVQILTTHTKNLSALTQSPDVNIIKLHDILEELDQHIAYLHELGGKIGENLRRNEFLNQIRMHLANPAGACETTLPPLQLWLNRPAQARQHDLKVWCSPFIKLLDAIYLLLKLIRQGTPTTAVVACRGLYQQNQDSTVPYDLLRLSITSTLNVFPEFSANKHRIMIRFMLLDLGGRKPLQTQEDIAFHLRCCRG